MTDATTELVEGRTRLDSRRLPGRRCGARGRDLGHVLPDHRYLVNAKGQQPVLRNKLLARKRPPLSAPVRQATA